MPSDPWSTDAWRGSAFEGYADLLWHFVEYTDWPGLGDLERQWLEARSVATSEGKPLRLVHQPSRTRRARPRRRSSLYDISVREGALPTRSRNWHDFFNVMMFAAFARAKRMLHSRHSRILEERLPEELVRLPEARTEEQDCLTLLDEGGVLLVTGPSESERLEAALDTGAHEEIRALVRGGRVKPWLFGHAHLEHLARLSLRNDGQPSAFQGPHLPNAKAVVLEVGAAASRPQIDETLAERIGDRKFCAERDRRRPISLSDLFLDLVGHD